MEPAEGKPPSFDVILLGMGPDGHIASLFPNHPLLKYNDQEWVVYVTDSPKPPPQRITFTLPVINNAKHIAFVVTGSAKKEVLSQIFQGQGSMDLPASLVQPVSGKLDWFLDADAAQLLPKSYL